ncbi:hypothetical protein GOV07_01390 [Candidatus Woesearchaeota archaeon]|nr:hypothetical protein [Candidatus Woesearchaeota archaeon]
MTRHGQTALEFLTTYGWGAFLILMVLIVMAYFSVLNPQLLIPEMCNFPESSGIDCSVNDASTDGSLTLMLRNTHTDVSIVDASCIYEDQVKIVTKNVLVDGESIAGQSWPHRASKILTCKFDGDNPFAGHANQKSMVLIELSVQRDSSIHSFAAPVRVLIEANS